MSFGSFIDRLPGLGSPESTAADSTPAVDESMAHAATAGAGGWVSAFLGLLGFGQSASTLDYDHGHGGSHYWGMEDMLQLRRTLFWIAAVVVVLLIAAITNPTEASFRSHLTELSFRRHLADIRHSSTEPEDDASAAEPGPPTISGHASTGTLLTVSGADTPPIAPFRFANHVSISLRTPPLYYKTLFFLSIALTSPLATPIYLSDPPLGKKAPLPPRERSVLYIGYFGHWVVVGTVPHKVEWVWRLFTEGGKEKGKRKNALLDRSGITELRSIAGKEDGIGARALVSATAPLLSATKNIRRSDSVSNLAENGTLPLHSHPTSIPIAPFVAESRRSSIVNLLPSQPTSNEVFDSASSPLLTALKADLTAAQSALSEVKSQLHALEESVSTAHSSLQTSLDEVRSRRKEDDGERQELKSRTKGLEEQKRQAEAARREAEKKLKAIEGVRDGLESKIQAALNEIQDFKGLVDVSTRAVRTVQEEGARFLIETRENVERRREELEEVEGDIGELDARNEELGRAIQEAEEKVEEARRAGEEAKKLGPEEEMMMMAAAYEAAAQEGYGHAGQHPGSAHAGQIPGHSTHAHGGHVGHAHAFGNRNVNGNNSGGGGNNSANSSDQQWAHQAAQYMAEAGMPHIDQNYSARPSHSTSFGQFARPHKATEDKRPADLLGFEDFGPGALGAALGGMGGSRQTTTPPASDSGSDIWGHDPGSPNGGISSSFSANLLPQGLFRSLEGDTPLDANTEVDEESVAGALDNEHDHDERDVNGFDMDLGTVDDAAMDHGVEDDGSDIDSSNSGRDADVEPDQHIWRSPLPAPNALTYPAHANSAHQLLPPSSRTPPSGSNPAHQHSAPSLPGLPALPGSRRWYSGTTSSSQENVNVFGVSPSNDSLLLAAYESSPFAPSSSERQQLALKWGSLGRRWGKDHAGQVAAVGAHASGQAAGQGHGQSVTRSFSADLGAGWLPSRLRRDDHAHDTHDHAHDEHDKDGKDGSPNALAPERASGEKKPFRFFSLRRPTSSGSASMGERTGTSPARE